MAGSHALISGHQGSDQTRKRNSRGLADRFGGEPSQRRFIRIDFYHSLGTSRCPIDDVTEQGGGSNHHGDINISAREKIFHDGDFAWIELFAKPNHSGPHQRSALIAARQFFMLKLVIMIMITIESRRRMLAPATASHKNVAMDLHHLLPGQSGSRMEIVHVL